MRLVSEEEVERIIRHAELAACQLLGHDYYRDHSLEGYWIRCRRCRRRVRRLGMERRERCRNS